MFLHKCGERKAGRMSLSYLHATYHVHGILALNIIGYSPAIARQGHTTFLADMPIRKLKLKLRFHIWVMQRGLKVEKHVVLFNVWM